MLVKQDLEKKIETAIHDAMKKAMSEMNKAMQNAVNGNGDGSDFSVSGAIDTFADEAKKCASDIASAIDEYIKSATITINAGTLIKPLPGLASPAGPVTGDITLAAPTTLQKSIS